jgi:hypothetical protein
VFYRTLSRVGRLVVNYVISKINSVSNFFYVNNKDNNLGTISTLTLILHSTFYYNLL